MSRIDLIVEPGTHVIVNGNAYFVAADGWLDRAQTFSATSRDLAVTTNEATDAAEVGCAAQLSLHDQITALLSVVDEKALDHATRTAVVTELRKALRCARSGLASDVRNAEAARDAARAVLGVPC